MKRGLLATDAEFAAIKERLGRRPFNHIYDVLARRCHLILESHPITEQQWRAAYDQGQFRPATSAVVAGQGRIFDLIVAHKIDRNTAYRDRAIEELRNIVNFSTWVDPSHKDAKADLCTAEACATVAIALDWLAEELSEADRIRCQRALRTKGLQPYLQAVEAGAFWHNVYHNWNAVVNGGVALAGLLLWDEEDIAPVVVNKARIGLKNFFAALGREGGWDEGLGYWGYAMRYVLLLGEALDRLAKDGEIFHHRGMDCTGLFPVYFSPHGLAVSFGDLPITPAWGVFYLLVKHFGLKEMAWWLDRYAFRHDVSTSGYSDAGLALLFRPEDWEAEPAPDLHPVKAFNEIGWAAMADHWPAPQLYAALKTGDLSAHHAQLDMNSLQVAVDGEILLHDPGSPEFTKDYFSADGRHNFYEVQSSSHNTIVLADRLHRIDAVGSIVEAQDAPQFRWIAGDGGTALGDDVHFIRHAVMCIGPDGAGRMLVVLDEIRNVVPEVIQSAWHTSGQVELKAGSSGGAITGEEATLYFALAGNCPLIVSSRERSFGARRMDRAIVAATPALAEAYLVSVFSPSPIGKIKVNKTGKGDLTVMIGSTHLYWRSSRRYLRLDQIKQ